MAIDPRRSMTDSRIPPTSSQDTASEVSPERSNPEVPDGLRLQVALARAGVASRRAAAEAIKAGRVAVNGTVIREPGHRVQADRDQIRFDGEPVGVEPLRYYLLHKPRGVLSTVSDDRDRPVVTEYLPDDAGRCVPVGRLDFTSEGLLLLTNDGPLIEGLLHPRYEVPREYAAEVEGQVSDGVLERIEKGVRLEDGSRASAQTTRLNRKATPGRTWLGLVLRQGRKHEVRRIGDAVGHPVRRLIRVRFGPLLLGDLAPGQIRELTAKELSSLHERAGVRGKSGPPATPASPGATSV
jgi:23S rRNA pseudouridine2605 synthase